MYLHACTPIFYSCDPRPLLLLSNLQRVWKKILPPLPQKNGPSALTSNERSPKWEERDLWCWWLSCETHHTQPTPTRDEKRRERERHSRISAPSPVFYSLSSRYMWKKAQSKWKWEDKSVITGSKERKKAPYSLSLFLLCPNRDKPQWGETKKKGDWANIFVEGKQTLFPSNFCPPSPLSSLSISLFLPFPLSALFV